MEIKNKKRTTKRKRELQIKTKAAGIVIILAVLLVFFAIQTNLFHKSATVSSESAVETEEQTEIDNSDGETTEIDDSDGEQTVTDSLDEEQAATDDSDGELVNENDSDSDLSEDEVVQEVKTVTKVDAQFLDLQEKIEEITQDASGIWSVYVKDLNSGAVLCLNSQEMYAASLIKLFVMESVYRNWEEIISRESEEIVTDTLKIMIQQSDNEAYNELIRLHDENQNFMAGCLELNDYVRINGYENTGIYHTLSPSDTEHMSISELKNHTSVEDCGKLLEDIYRGTDVSEEASAKMLELLLGQETTYKIPAGLPNGVKVANKSGETEETEHDVAIVYGTDTDYILCVMSSGIEDEDEAVSVINSISSCVYYDLNTSVPIVTEAPERNEQNRGREGGPPGRR